MIEYLSGHYRYNTMNSWNRATSYAKCVKLSHMTFPDNETRNRAYDLLGTEEVFEEVRFIMDQFAANHYYEWQAGFNGRSAGYIVLYHGGRKPSEYKSWCSRCGQGNFSEATDADKRCGVCKADARYNQQRYQTFTYPGKGVDEDEDFSEWDTYRLRERVKLIMEFDRMVEDCERAFIGFCKTHKAEERVISVPKTITVAVEV